MQATYAQAKSAGSNTLLTAAQERLDAAKAELDAARLDYEHMLTSAAAESVVMARARVAVARATLDNARDALLRLQTGDDSPQVTAARAAVAAAEAAVGQAEAGRAQAVQALRLAEAALERTAVAAPADGVVLARNLEAGEIAVAGGTVMRVAPLDTLELVVYLPEDRYGRVLLGDRVSLTVDSYPAQAFGGTVVHIADEAEFTPRNVQTVEGRRSTVYAVKIRVANPELPAQAGHAGRRNLPGLRRPLAAEPAAPRTATGGEKKTVTTPGVFRARWPVRGPRGGTPRGPRRQALRRDASRREGTRRETGLTGFTGFSDLQPGTLAICVLIL